MLGEHANPGKLIFRHLINGQGLVRLAGSPVEKLPVEELREFARLLPFCRVLKRANEDVFNADGAQIELFS